MRVAEGVDGDAAEKIQILFAAGIKNTAAASVSKLEGLALVSGEKKPFRVAEARIDGGVRGAHLLGPAQGAGDGTLFFAQVAHQATEKAACASGMASRKTRVPGISVAASGEEAACETRSRESGEPPPTMRTSRTPPSRARLAASSFKTMPPEMPMAGQPSAEIAEARRLFRSPAKTMTATSRVSRSVTRRPATKLLSMPMRWSVAVKRRPPP